MKYKKPGHDKFYSIAVRDFSFAMVGSSFSLANYTSAANIVLLNQSGNITGTLELNTSKGEEFRKIIVSSDQNYVCAGYSNSNTSSVNAIYIAKVDTFLNIVWQTYLGNSTNCWPFDIVETKDSGFVISSLSNYNSQSSDLSFIKLNRNGILQWQTNLGSFQTEWSNSILELGNGNILGAGWGNTAFQTSDMNLQLYLIDSTGLPLNTKVFYSLENEGIYCAKHYFNDKLIVAGGAHTFNNLENCFIVMLDSNLNALQAWQYEHTMDNGRCKDVIVLADSSIILGIQMFNTNEDYVCLIKIDKFGSKIWSKKYSLSKNTFIGSLSLAKNYDIICCGYTLDSLTGEYDSYAFSIDSIGISVNDCFADTTSFIQIPYTFDSSSVSLSNISPLNTLVYTPTLTTTIYTENSLCPPPAPVTAFASSDTVFCDKQYIDFYDLSQNNPTSWLWFFQGGSPSVSTVQNPSNIYFPNAGAFDVLLISCNVAACDTLFIPGFIIEHPLPGMPTVSVSGDTLYCSSAYSYGWYNTNNAAQILDTAAWYAPTVAGNYYCLVTDSNGCSIPSNVVGVALGSPQWLPPKLQITYYGQTIHINQSEGQYRCVLYNNLGSPLYKWQHKNGSSTFSTAGLAGGVYILILEDIDTKKYYRTIITIQP